MKITDPDIRDRREILYGHSSSRERREAERPREKTPEEKLRQTQYDDSAKLKEKHARELRDLRLDHDRAHRRDYQNQRDLPDPVLRKHESQRKAVEAKHATERAEQAALHRRQRDQLRALRATGSAAPGRPAA